MSSMQKKKYELMTNFYLKSGKRQILGNETIL